MDSTIIDDSLYFDRLSRRLSREGRKKKNPCKNEAVSSLRNRKRGEGERKKKSEKKEKKGKKSEPDDNRLVKAGWNVYQSVDLSMRVVPQKNMEIYFPPAFRYIRENGKRHGVCRTFVTRLFFLSLFFRCMNLSGGFFTGAGYLRCIRRVSTFVDMIFLFIRAQMRIRKNISRLFILTHDAGSQ